METREEMNGGDGRVDEGEQREEAREETMTMKMTNDHEYDDYTTITTTITR